MTRNKQQKYIENLREQYLKDMQAILATPAGLRFFGRMLVNMNLFSDVYTSNSIVYKNAALADFARRLTEDMDRIDLQHLVKIKQIIREDRKAMEDLNKDK